jgi:RNA-directed DNA polymerase
LNELIRSALEVELGNKYKFTPEELQIFESSENGIPQGSSLSPLLSNVYLSIFDKKMLRAGFGLVRYADDFVVLCKTDDDALKAYKLAKSIIEEELNLKLYPLQRDSDETVNSSISKTKIVHPSQNPIKFLSVRYNGERSWPDVTKMNDLKFKLRELSKNTNISVKDYLGAFERKLRGWLAAFHFTDVDIYLDKLDSEVNEILSHGLALRGWVLQRQKKTKDGRFIINKRQRTNSGIKHCTSILAEIRNNKVGNDGNKLKMKALVMPANTAP